MAVEVIKIPKKFAEICALIRDGQPEGMEKLRAYDGLEHQKTAVLAQCAYFDGDPARGLELDKTLCPWWGQWRNSNIRTEHVDAMAFAARQLGREREITDFFKEQIALIEADDELPAHIKNSYIAGYKNSSEHIQTGIMPHFTKEETYQPPEDPITVAEIRAMLEERIHDKKDKPVDFDSPEGIYKLFLRTARMGNAADAMAFYRQIAHLDMPHSVDWQITALSICNYMGDEEEGFGVVLQLARQRLWYVADATQVRPMEFFSHPAVLPYLGDEERLKAIVGAACNK